MNNSAIALATAGFLAATGITATPAKASVEFGILECIVEGGAGFVFGSSKNLECTFTPAGDAGTQKFAGVINKYGIDVGVTGAEIIQWGVVASEDDMTYEPGVIEGRYVGASASASATLGGGVNVLVGGNDDSISLQPVSVQEQAGVNVAVGIAELELVRMQ